MRKGDWVKWKIITVRSVYVKYAEVRNQFAAHGGEAFLPFS